MLAAACRKLIVMPVTNSDSVGIPTETVDLIVELRHKLVATGLNEGPDTTEILTWLDGWRRFRRAGFGSPAPARGARQWTSPSQG
jgi:hypothetical protein